MAVLFPELRKWKKQVVHSIKLKVNLARLRWRLRKAGVTADMTLKPMGFTTALELFQENPEILRKQAALKRTRSGLPARWLVYPPCTHQFALPKTVERDDVCNFRPWEFVQRPPYYVYRLPNTLYHGKSGAAVDGRQRVYKDLVDWGAQGSPKLLNSEKKEPCFCRGNAAVLSSSKNYYHWLIKMLPRLHLLERVGMPPAAFDALLINWPTPVQQEAYVHSDLSSRELRVVSSRDFWFCRDLFVSNVPHDGPPWAVEFIRDLFAPLIEPAPGKVKGVYLARGKTVWRRVRNEDEVSELLQRRGIETLDFSKCSFEDQVRIMAGADIIVAPHGAALSNIVFARKGTRVLEIFGSPENQKCYWMLAEQRQMIYHYCLADRIESSDDLNRCDLFIPLEKLEKALDALMEDRDRQHEDSSTATTL
jgi:hypothetical protein